MLLGVCTLGVCTLGVCALGVCGTVLLDLLILMGMPGMWFMA